MVIESKSMEYSHVISYIIFPLLPVIQILTKIKMQNIKYNFNLGYKMGRLQIYKSRSLSAWAWHQVFFCVMVFQKRVESLNKYKQEVELFLKFGWIIL